MSHVSESTRWLPCMQSCDGVIDSRNVLPASKYQSESPLPQVVCTVSLTSIES